jgi:hypothetical protein
MGQILLQPGRQPPREQPQLLIEGGKNLPHTWGIHHNSVSKRSLPHRWFAPSVPSSPAQPTAPRSADSTSVPPPRSDSPLRWPTLYPPTSALAYDSTACLALPPSRAMSPADAEVAIPSSRSILPQPTSPIPGQNPMSSSLHLPLLSAIPSNSITPPSRKKVTRTPCRRNPKFGVRRLRRRFQSRRIQSGDSVAAIQGGDSVAAIQGGDSVAAVQSLECADCVGAFIAATCRRNPKFGVRRRCRRFHSGDMSPQSKVWSAPTVSALS